MREILFRGKRKDNGKWIEGGYCFYNNKSYIIIATQYIPDTRDWDTATYYEENPVYKPTFIEVYPKTVGQYTNKMDKNGTKIFEGDVIAYDNLYSYVVQWDDERCGFYAKMKKYDDYDYLGNFRTRLSEVIGNIHDNPELLNN